MFFKKKDFSNGDEKTLKQRVETLEGELEYWKDQIVELNKLIEGVIVMETIENAVINLIVEKLGVKKENVKLKSNIVNDLGADSLDVVELTIEVEEQFKIDINDEEVSKVNTVGDIINLIKTKQQS